MSERLITISIVAFGEAERRTHVRFAGKLQVRAAALTADTDEVRASPGSIKDLLSWREANDVERGRGRPLHRLDPPTGKPIMLWAAGRVIRFSF